MKFIKLFLFTLLSFGLFLSCSSDDDNGNGNTSEFFLRATIDGNQKDFSVEGDVLCTYTSVSTIMNITSTYQDASKLITLSIMNFTGEGSYPIGNSGNHYALAQYVVNNESFSNI